MNWVSSYKVAFTFLIPNAFLCNPGLFASWVFKNYLLGTGFCKNVLTGQLVNSPITYRLSILAETVATPRHVTGELQMVVGICQ